MDFLAMVRSHLDRVTSTGLAVGYGPDDTPMWMSSLDIHTGRYPANDTRPPDIPKRVYRFIDAPRGCSLYWDQPQVVAAHVLSQLCGDERYARAADAYTGAFLDRCVSRPTGLLLWGNHYYWDAFAGCVKCFPGSLEPWPTDPVSCEGNYHETRPLMPAWWTFWRISPEMTERTIRAMGNYHIYDTGTGEFNRHADRRRGYPFLESGGILVHSLCWLYAQTSDRRLLDQALRVARFSFDTRHPLTGLLPNSPGSGRWDEYNATSEVGLWAGSLLGAAALTGEKSFVVMAAETMASFLRFAYQPESGRLYGRIRIEDGIPTLGDKDTPYQPGDESDPWESLFPTHDYPIALGDTALTLYQHTGDHRFDAPIHVPVPGDRIVYIEQYGRCIRYLHRLGLAGNTAALRQSRHLATEAVQLFFREGMFRTHTGEDRYDAVDGTGFLLLALLELHAGCEPDQFNSRV